MELVISWIRVFQINWFWLQSSQGYLRLVNNVHKHALFFPTPPFAALTYFLVHLCNGFGSLKPIHPLNMAISFTIFRFEHLFRAWMHWLIWRFIRLHNKHNNAIISSKRSQDFTRSNTYVLILFVFMHLLSTFFSIKHRDIGKLNILFENPFDYEEILLRTWAQWSTCVPLRTNSRTTNVMQSHHRMID